MIGLGTLSPFEDVQALIKGKVGEFLQAEGIIRKYLQHTSASIRAEAAGLLAEHTLLEGELGSAQTKIAQFQQGAWSFSDVISLGDVGTRLVQHLSKVTSLEQKATGVYSPSMGLLTGAAPILGVVAVATVALWIILRR
jgi:hypothetical protein